MNKQQIENAIVSIQIDVQKKDLSALGFIAQLKGYEYDDSKDCLDVSFEIYNRETFDTLARIESIYHHKEVLEDQTFPYSTLKGVKLFKEELNSSEWCAINKVIKAICG